MGRRWKLRFILLLALASSMGCNALRSAQLSSQSQLSVTVASSPQSSQSYGVKFNPFLKLTVPTSVSSAIESSTVTLKSYTDSNCSTQTSVSLSGNTASFTSGAAEFTNLNYPGTGTIYLAVSSSSASNYAIRSSCLGPYTLGLPYVYFAGQKTTGTGQQVTKALFDPVTSSITSIAQTEIDLSGGLLRGFSFSPREAFFVVGDGLSMTNSKRSTSITDFSTGSSALTLTGTAISGAHQSCHLPNGNMIVGEGTTNGKVNEYTASGTFIREVLTLALTGYSAYCFAMSDTELLLIEGDASINSKVYRMQLTNSAWQMATNGTFDGAAFSAANSTNLKLWSFGYDGSEYIYFGSFQRDSSGPLTAATKFVRCPVSNLTHTNCSEFGDAISTSNPTDRLDAITLIPGTKDFLYATTAKLYRFNSTTGAVTYLNDFSAFIPDHSLVRYIDFSFK
jgi:hypothetical protein